VFNPYLTKRAPLSHLGEGPGVRGNGASIEPAGRKGRPLPLTPNPSPAGEGDACGGCHGVALAFGAFPEPGHLNTS